MDRIVECREFFAMITNKTKSNALEKRYKAFERVHRYRCKHMMFYPIKTISDFGMKFGGTKMNKCPKVLWVTYDGLEDELRERYDEMVEVGTIYKCSKECNDPDKVIDMYNNATI